jgi:hypothetical protein
MAVAMSTTTWGNERTIRDKVTDLLYRKGKANSVRQRCVNVQIEIYNVAGTITHL